MEKYIIALTGAKKNVGDFLITYRALELLKDQASEYKICVLPYWEKVEDINFINKSEGVVILGGPGYQEEMIPKVYNILDDLDRFTVPVYILGGGWYGKPGDKITEKLYKFNKETKKLLTQINNSHAGLSVRDFQTKRVLENNGFNNVVMTGCPVWYDLNFIGKQFEKPEKIKNIILTPAQHPRYNEQSKELIKYIREKYNDANILVSFHRGIGNIDRFTGENDAKNTKDLADYSIKLGCEVIDVSYDEKKLDVYLDYDLHIGYRVHAHIYFLSKRKPSILLHEDGRGNGVTESMKSPGINAYKITKSSELFKFAPKSRYSNKLRSKYGIKVNDNMINELNHLLNEIEKNEYNIFEQAVKQIDATYPEMKKFISNIVK